MSTNSTSTAASPPIPEPTPHFEQVCEGMEGDVCEIVEEIKKQLDKRGPAYLAMHREPSRFMLGLVIERLQEIYGY